MESVSKKTVKINVFSSIPRDVWAFLLLPKMYMKTIGLLAQTCRAGRRVIDQLRTNNLHLAKLYRKKRQFPLALKCLWSCVDYGDKEAVFHLAFAYLSGGHEWGIGKSMKWQAHRLFKSISKEPLSIGRVFYALCLRMGYGCVQDTKKAFRIGQEILNSKKCDPYVRGICLYFGIGFPWLENNINKACNELEKSLELFEEENEYALYYLGMCYAKKFEMRFFPFEDRSDYYKRAIFYFGRAAEHGLQIAQQSLDKLYGHCHQQRDEVQQQNEIQWHNPEKRDDRLPIFLIAFGYSFVVFSLLVLFVATIIIN